MKFTPIELGAENENWLNTYRQDRLREQRDKKRHRRDKKTLSDVAKKLKKPNE